MNYPVRGREFGSRFKGRTIAHLASRREAGDDGKKGEQKEVEEEERSCGERHSELVPIVCCCWSGTHKNRSDKCTSVRE